MESKKIKILAIDDNQDNLITIKALVLEAFNDALVFTALSGEKGLELATVEDPDVILLDIVMPGMDGFEVCEKLKADKKLGDIPVVFVTAIKGDQEGRIRGLEVGAEAFLSKPIDEIELTAQIRAMAKIKSANVERHNEKEHLAALVIEKTRELKENHVATLNLLDDLKNENRAREETEKALRVSEEKFRIMTENSSDVIWHLDKNFICDYISPADERMRGFKQDEVIGKPLWSMLMPDGIELLKKANAKRISEHKKGVDVGKSIYVLEQICKDGNTIWTEASTSPQIDENGEIIGYHGVTRDITDRKRAQEALSESEKKYRLITEKISDVVWLMDLSGKSLFVSQSVEDFSGFTVDEYLSHTISDRFTPDSAKIALEALSHEVAHFNDKKHHSADYRKLLLLDYICKDGSIKTGEVLFSPYLDENGKLIAIHGVTRDVTARKKAENALRESEEKYREMTDLLPQIVYETDDNGNITYLNKQAQSICGYDEDEYMLGVNMLNFFTVEDRPRIINNFKRRITGQVLDDKGFTLVRNDGSTFPSMVYSNPIIKDNKSIGIRGIIVDISEQKKAERNLEHIARLYAFLGQTNQAIVRVRTQNELFQAICQVAVEHGKFHMAWVGLLDKSDKQIKPIAVSGFDDKYLDDICIIPGHEIYGKGTTGRAFQEDKIIFCNDIANDPMMTSWRDEAIKRGYRSSVAVPFNLKGEVIGVLTLYAKEMNFFNEDEKIMLQKIGEDISFALDAMASEAERIQFETELEGSRNELKAIYENAPVMMCVLDEDANIIFENNAFKSFTDISEADFKNGQFGNVISCISALEDNRGCGFGKNCSVCALRLAILTTLKTGVGKREIEYQTTTVQNGIKRDVSLVCSTALINNSGQSNLLLCLHDITDRKKTEEALQKSERFLRTFIENTPFEIWARDTDNVGILENKKMVDHFGSILGKTPASFSNKEPEVIQLWEDNNRRAFKGELIDEVTEYEIDNHLFKYQQIIFPIYNNGVIIGIAGFNIDITERARIEDELKESQSLYYSFIEQLPNAVFRKDREGLYVLVNSQFCKLKGVTKEEAIGSKPQNVLINKKALHGNNGLASKYPSIGENIHEKILKTGKFYETEEEYDMPEGGKQYMHVVRMPVLDSYGNVIGSQGIMFDITERKRVEEALNISQEKLKQFAAHLQNIREEERTDLAREIHDDLGQILIALKIDLGLMRQKVLKLVDSKLLDVISSNFDNLFGLVDNTIKTTRRIMTGLRPEVLELLGLVEATKLYTNDFQERHKISCKFECSISKLEINLQQSVALYRILQEGLSNVARHAKATEVKVELSIQANKLLMEIKDNGVGFDELHKGRSDSYGMIGMKERVFLLEGELFITSKPDNGTTVRIEMPYVEPV